MLLGAGPFLNQLMLFRQCHIKGRLGGGKTLLAFVLAQKLIGDKVSKGCISNIPHGLPLPPWNEPEESQATPWNDIPPLEMGADYQVTYNLAKDTVFVYDEPWVKLDNRTSMTNDRMYGAFARKLGIIMLYPSVIAIDKRNSYLSCQRVFRFSVPVVRQAVGGLVWLLDQAASARWRPGAKLGQVLRQLITPIDWLGGEFWVYKWSVELGYMQDGGSFILARPTSYFGLYDTKYIPLDDGDISELYQRTILQEKQGDVGNGKWWINESDEQAEVRTLRQVTGRGSSTDTDYLPEVRSIAFPFSGRPNVAISED